MNKATHEDRTQKSIIAHFSILPSTNHLNFRFGVFIITGINSGVFFHFKFDRYAIFL
jgi:hypothetical protein